MSIRRLTSAIVSVALLVVMSGCANWKSVFHTFQPSEGQSVTIDAKQRAIYAFKKSPMGTSEEWTAICAEPSPDALSAISAAADLDASALGKALGASFASQESAASIGLRTQSIQILRDAMYRLCEGYASGAIDDIGFSRLQRRYQNIMLGLLSIEQLTGTMVANQVALQGSASAKVGQSLSQVTSMIADQRDKVTKAATSSKDAKTKADEAKKAADDAKIALDKALKDAGGDSKVQAVVDAEAEKGKLDDQASAAKANADTATAALTSQQAELKSLEEVRKDLERASLSISSSISFQAVNNVTGRQSADIQKVSETVEKIVGKIVDHDYTRDTCLDTMTSRTSSTLARNPEVFKATLYYCALILSGDKGAAAGDKRAAGVINMDAIVAAYIAVVDKIHQADETEGEKRGKKANVPASSASGAGDMTSP